MRSQRPASGQLTFAPAVALALALWGLPAYAAKEGAKGALAVPTLSTPPTMIGLGVQVTREVEKAALSEGYLVLSASEVEAQLGSRRVQQLRQCEGRLPCQAALLAATGAKRAVVGSLSRSERAYLLRLYLVELPTGEVVADVDRDILIASRRLQQDVAEAVPRLLRGLREARGILEVTTNAKAAQVFVDGRPVGTAPLQLELKPGRYEVRLERRSYLGVKRLVDVEAERAVSEDFRLILEPGAVPEEDALPSVPLAAVEAEGPGLRIHPPAWVALGAAAVAGGAGAWFGVRAMQTENRLRREMDLERGVYQGTRADALSGRADARNANVLYAVAGAAAAAGVVLTVLEVGSGQALTAAPQAGPTGAGLRLGGSF